MKYLVILFVGITLFSFHEKEHSPENFLEDTKWKISSHAFADIEQEQYFLTAHDDSEEWAWGTFVSFDEKTFGGSYSAPCGNDCFVSTTGEYKIIDEQIMFVDVHNILKFGFCSDSGEDTVGFKAYYNYESFENGYVLTKTKKP